MPAGKCGIRSDKTGDLAVEGLDVPIDLLNPLPTLALEKGNSEVLFPVFERGAITDQAIAGIDKFGHLRLLPASGGPD